MNNGSVILLLVSFGFIALMYVVLYVLVRWGNKRERVRQQQQRQITDPVVLVRVLASVRLQASWFMKMLLWGVLIMLALILYATIQLRISGVPLDTGDWVSAGLLIVFTPGAVWGLAARPTTKNTDNSKNAHTANSFIEQTSLKQPYGAPPRTPRGDASPPPHCATSVRPRPGRRCVRASPEPLQPPRLRDRKSVV